MHSVGLMAHGHRSNSGTRMNTHAVQLMFCLPPQSAFPDSYQRGSCVQMLLRISQADRKGQNLLLLLAQLREALRVPRAVRQRLHLLSSYLSLGSPSNSPWQFAGAWGKVAPRSPESPLSSFPGP
jgi:hypothetical protein